MYWMIELPVILALLGFMMARQASRILWTAVLTALLGYWTLRYTPPAWALLIAWGIFIPLATLLTVTAAAPRHHRQTAACPLQKDHAGHVRYGT